MPDPHAAAGVFASRPLPRPIYTTVATPTRDRTARDSHLGTLVHRVLAEVIEAACLVPLVEAVALVGEAAERAVPHGRGAARTRTMVRSHAAAYVSRFLPGPDCTFLGAEIAVPGGRVDLGWEHPSVGVWFDEVKTWRHSREVWDAATHDQIGRYLTAGREQFGDRFAGVRLVITGNGQDCVVIDPAGEVTPLTQSRLAPRLLAAQGAA